jgi:hypothetical protein
MLLLVISYVIHAILNPLLFKSTQCAKSPSVYKKSSGRRLQEQKLGDSKVMGIISGIVENAAMNNRLKVSVLFTSLFSFS